MDSYTLAKAKGQARRDIHKHKPHFRLKSLTSVKRNHSTVIRIRNNKYTCELILTPQQADHATQEQITTFINETVK